jgi:hypothetical protein
MKFNRLCNSVGEVRHHGRLKNVIRVRLVFGQQREVDIHQLEYALHQVDAAQQGQHFADHAPAYLHQREAITDICPYRKSYRNSIYYGNLEGHLNALRGQDRGRLSKVIARVWRVVVKAPCGTHVCILVCLHTTR